MSNLTARLAVRIEDLPDWEFSWGDTKPQRSRHSLTCEDFLPTADDGLILKSRAVLFTMEILVSHFPSLGHLKNVLPSHTSPHTRHSQKSEVVPLKILPRDEKYITENIEILTDLLTTADLSGDK